MGRARESGHRHLDRRAQHAQRLHALFRPGPGLGDRAFLGGQDRGAKHRHPGLRAAQRLGEGFGADPLEGRWTCRHHQYGLRRRLPERGRHGGIRRGGGRLGRCGIELRPARGHRGAELRRDQLRCLHGCGRFHHQRERGARARRQAGVLHAGGHPGLERAQKVPHRSDRRILPGRAFADRHRLDRRLRTARRPRPAQRAGLARAGEHLLPLRGFRRVHRGLLLHDQHGPGGHTTLGEQGRRHLQFRLRLPGLRLRDQHLHHGPGPELEWELPRGRVRDVAVLRRVPVRAQCSGGGL